MRTVHAHGIGACQAKHLLDLAPASTLLQQMMSEGVAQRMRREVSSEPGARRPTFDNQPQPLSAQAVAALVEEQRSFIRPARQEQKRVEGTIRDLRVGDEVITTAGFFARVKDIQTPEEGPVQLILELGNGLEVRALTSAIAQRVSPAPDPVELPEEAGT